MGLLKPLYDNQVEGRDAEFVIPGLREYTHTQGWEAWILNVSTSRIYEPLGIFHSFIFFKIYEIELFQQLSNMHNWGELTI